MGRGVGPRRRAATILDRLTPGRRRRRDAGADRPQRLRQDHRAPAGERAAPPQRRRGARRRAARRPRGTRSAPPPHRLRHPGDRPPAAPDRRRQRRASCPSWRAGTPARRAARVEELLDAGRPPGRRVRPRAIRISSPADSASASAWRARSPPIRRSSCWTSRSARSIRSRAASCRTRSARCSDGCARRPSSSPTTCARRRRVADRMGAARRRPPRSPPARPTSSAASRRPGGARIPRRGRGLTGMAARDPAPRPGGTSCWSPVSVGDRRRGRRAARHRADAPAGVAALGARAPPTSSRRSRASRCSAS